MAEPSRALFDRLVDVADAGQAGVGDDFHPPEKRPFAMKSFLSRRKISTRTADRAERAMAGLMIKAHPGLGHGSGQSRRRPTGVQDFSLGSAGRDWSFGLQICVAGRNDDQGLRRQPEPAVAQFVAEQPLGDFVRERCDLGRDPLLRRVR